MTFSERLSEGVKQTNTCLCVGIDPWPDRLPGRQALGADPKKEELAGLAGRFSHAVVDACAGLVPAVKPQFAFFEALGPAGMTVLADVCGYARAAGLVVIGDAKRGDIGSTAEAYATATLGANAPFPCDALTVSPFLGPETVRTFLDAATAAACGVFVLVRTSNPGSRRWQAPVVEDLTRWIAENSVADGVGFSPLGVVVGATNGAEIAEIRDRCPRSWLLVPGFGAQGGSARDARRALRDDGLGALIVSARGATFPAGVDPRYDRDPTAWIRTRVAATVAELRP